MAKQAKRGKTKKEKGKSLNTHDAFFKTTFSYPEIARNYIEHFIDKDLVKNIDLDSLILENTNYVTPELERQRRRKELISIYLCLSL